MRGQSVVQHALVAKLLTIPKTGKQGVSVGWTDLREEKADRIQFLQPINQRCGSRAAWSRGVAGRMIPGQCRNPRLCKELANCCDKRISGKFGTESKV